MTEKRLTYADSGVDISAQDEAIARFKAAVEATHGSEVVAGVGAFGAGFAPHLGGVGQPVLISSTDSLGTKTMLHGRFGTYEWAGRDVIGCVVNDVIVSGARPLFFLDYLALNKVEPDQVAELVGGVAAACGEINCALIGGEIAEMRDVYQPGDFDLVGFAVGMVDRDKMMGDGRVQSGDVLVGLESSGVHCNGFSLVRHALAGLSDDEWLTVNPQLGASLRDALLVPTRCYANIMAEISAEIDIAAAAHISGGGLIDNLPRVLPKDLSARVDRNKIQIPPVFDIIQRQGNVTQEEMWHVFNMGIGFVLVVRPGDVDTVLGRCRTEGLPASVIGDVAPMEEGKRFHWLDRGDLS